MAQADFFLKVKDIPGESLDGTHKGEIEVLSWSWGESNSGGSAYGGGAGTGKVDMGDFSFTMRMCKASPKLIQACASGQVISETILIGRKAGKEQQEYLKFKFTDSMISHYTTSGTGSGDPVPMDSISFNYAKVEIEYKEQKADGTLGGAIKAGWDLKKNAPAA